MDNENQIKELMERIALLECKVSKISLNGAKK